MKENERKNTSTARPMAPSPPPPHTARRLSTHHMCALHHCSVLSQ